MYTFEMTVGSSAATNSDNNKANEKDKKQSPESTEIQLIQNWLKSNDEWSIMFGNILWWRKYRNAYSDAEMHGLIGKSHLKV